MSGLTRLLSGLSLPLVEGSPRDGSPSDPLLEASAADPLAGGSPPDPLLWGSSRDF